MDSNDLIIKRGSVCVLWAVTAGGLHIIIRQSPRGNEIRTTDNEIIAAQVFKRYRNR